MPPQRRLHVVHLYESWARADAVAPQPRRILGLRVAPAGELDLGRLFDTVMILLAVLLFDAVSVIAFRIGQDVQCGHACTLPVREHQLGVAEVMIGLVAVIPIITVLVVHTRRFAVIALQILVAGVLLTSTIGQQTHIAAEIHGTAPCWNTFYSPKDCPR
jgi:hypothetical protein